ncbi:DNA polymerase III PolC [Nitzschia inconspicua]|uniref:DNA polymerase III PolC n=1 Tax=Nitzschia inconspicua TaxID=303405 RepID=A0A9K3Q7F5_9STRA|nr:DNA polymerase III PolC [Nitzschia inconspicua]
MSAEQLPKRRKCGHCNREGHYRRTCPDLQGTQEDNNDNTETVLVGGQLGPPSESAMQEIDYEINWDQVCYVLFDLQTTGGSRTDEDIIELAALVLGPDGIALEDGSFESLIRPNKEEVSTYITSLTGISNDMVRTAPDLSTVMVDFFEFVNDVVNTFCILSSVTIDKIILVAYNGRVFDLPFLIRSLERHNLENLWADNERYGYTIDTLDVARRIFHNATRKPINMKLGSLFHFATGKIMENSHRASSVVKALYVVFRSELFWEGRLESLKDLTVDGTVVALPINNDSDVSDSDSDIDSSEGNAKTTTEQGKDDESTNDEEFNEIVGDNWERADFIPPETPMDKFTEYCNFNRRSGRVRTGIQVSLSSVDSPIKAWRLIFSAEILGQIVKHTNKYGRRNARDWTPINENDLANFIAVLFVRSIQKREDHPSNWFSANPLLESAAAKRITTGCQFGRMLRYLHCCDPDENGTTNDGEYDPSYKVLEFKRELEKRWSAVFVPHQELSLKETLLQARSKAAKNGDKLTVISDARSSFVLGVTVNTGEVTTSSESTNESTSKTVQIVQHLCKPFRGTYRTVYVDRSLISLDLLKQLEDMQLYTTGTILPNRIPREMTIPKNSAGFHDLNRGDAVTHLLTYTTMKGEKKEAGLVAWKDRNIVYCVTNDTSTTSMDECRRKEDGNVITIKCPQVITNYNENMAGVDVADTMHCNSTVLGQNRSWLGLFFCLLDIGTFNALVLYNEAIKGKKKPCDIDDFKDQLIDALVGGKIKDVLDDNRSVEHTMIHIPDGGRQRCTYCNLMGDISRTRFLCQGCGVPYCSVGSSKTKRDCFAFAHDNEQIRDICIQNYHRQQKNTRKDFLKQR